MKYYNLDDIHLENKNGIILLNNQPFQVLYIQCSPIQKILQKLLLL